VISGSGYPAGWPVQFKANGVLVNGLTATTDPTGAFSGASYTLSPDGSILPGESKEYIFTAFVSIPEHPVYDSLSASFTYHNNAQISLTPTEGSAGTTVRISGSGFPINYPVKFVINDFTSSGFTVTTDSKGAFGEGTAVNPFSYTIPVDGSVAPGQSKEYNFTAFCSIPDFPVYDSLSASFTYNNYAITITSNPAGSGFVKVDNVAITTPKTFTWAIGETHTITAISPISGNGMQYAYTGWSDGGTEKHDYTVQDLSDTVTAIYKIQYQVSFSQTGVDSSAGSRSIFRLNGVNYAYNALPTNVWVDSGTTFQWASRVSASTGKQFAYIGSSGTSPILSSGTYSATYKTQWQVTFAASPSGTGSTLPSTTAWYDEGFTIDPISATPNTGFTFVSWGSSSPSILFGSSSSTSTKATIEGPGIITANFAPELVVPEYYIGALAALAACFAAFYVIRKPKLSLRNK
jgi:hypothetical protein